MDFCWTFWGPCWIRLFIHPLICIDFIGTTTQLKSTLWRKNEFGFLTGQKEKIISFNSVLAVFHVSGPRDPRQPHLRAKQTGQSYLEQMSFLRFEYKCVWAHKTLMSSLKVVGFEFWCLTGMTRNLELAMNARLLTFCCLYVRNCLKIALSVLYVGDMLSVFFLCCFQR